MYGLKESSNPWFVGVKYQQNLVDSPLTSHIDQESQSFCVNSWAHNQFTYPFIISPLTYIIKALTCTSTYNRTWLHNWFSVGSPVMSADDESMLRPEWLDALVNDVAEMFVDMSWSSQEAAELEWGCHRWFIEVQGDIGLVCISGHQFGTGDELATEASEPSWAIACNREVISWMKVGVARVFKEGAQVLCLRDVRSGSVLQYFKLWRGDSKACRGSARVLSTEFVASYCKLRAAVGYSWRWWVPLPPQNKNQQYDACNCCFSLYPSFF